MDAILSLILKLSLIIAAAGAVFMGKKYFNTKDDNLIEEMVEQELKRQTGFDVDLTPDSSEDYPVEKV